MIRREESRTRIIANKQTVVLTLLVSTLCWAVGYVYSIGFPISTTNSTTLWQLLCSLILNKETAYLIGLLFLFGGAFLVHRTNYVLGLIREKTVLPFLFFILFVSTNPDFFPLKATSLAVLCMVLGMYQLFLSYHDPDDRRRAFDWAFLLSLGSLFWVHTLWFVPLFWFGMYQLRSLSLASFSASLFGILAVYWLALGWCVWQGEYTLFTESFGVLFQFKFMAVSGNMWELIGIGYSAILTVLAALNILLHEYADSLRTREYLSFLIFFAMWSFLLYVVYDYAAEEFLTAACIPVSILAGHFFTVNWNKWIAGLFYFTIILFISILFIRIWPNL